MLKLNKRSDLAKPELQKKIDIKSCQDFLRGLNKGDTEIGSLLFTGSDRELYLVKKLCRYYGVEFVDKNKILCTYSDCNNTFYVTHYYVKY